QPPAKLFPPPAALPSRRALLSPRQARPTSVGKLPRASAPWSDPLRPHVAADGLKIRLATVLPGGPPAAGIRSFWDSACAFDEHPHPSRPPKGRTPDPDG